MFKNQVKKEDAAAIGRASEAGTVKQHCTMESETIKNETSLFTNGLKGGRQNKFIFGACATVFVAVASVLIFYACQKDSSILSRKCMDNMREFDSMEALFKEVNALDEMSMEELATYEKAHGYKSFGRVADEIYFQLLRERAEEFGVEELGDDGTELTMEDAESFVAQYPNYLELYRIIYEEDCGYVPENGDEYKFTRKYADEPFYYIMNEDKIFKVAENYFKVFVDVVLYTEDIEVLMSITEANIDVILVKVELAIEAGETPPVYASMNRKSNGKAKLQGMQQTFPPCGKSYGREIIAYSPVTSNKERIKGKFRTVDDTEYIRNGILVIVIPHFQSNILVRAERRGIIWWDVPRTLTVNVEMETCVNGVKYSGSDNYSSGDPVFCRRETLNSETISEPINSLFIRSLTGTATIATTTLQLGYY